MAFQPLPLSILLPFSSSITISSLLTWQLQAIPQHTIQDDVFALKNSCVLCIYLIPPLQLFSSSICPIFLKGTLAQIRRAQVPYPLFLSYPSRIVVGTAQYKTLYTVCHSKMFLDVKVFNLQFHDYGTLRSKLIISHSTNDENQSLSLWFSYQNEVYQPRFLLLYVSSFASSTLENKFHGQYVNVLPENCHILVADLF